MPFFLMRVKLCVKQDGGRGGTERMGGRNGNWNKLYDNYIFSIKKLIAFYPQSQPCFILLFKAVTKKNPKLLNSLISRTLIHQSLCISPVCILFSFLPAPPNFPFYTFKFSPLFKRPPLWETYSLQVSSLLLLQWKCRFYPGISLTWEILKLTIDLLSLPFYSGGGPCAFISQYYFHGILLPSSLKPTTSNVLSSDYIFYCHHDLYIPCCCHGPYILYCCHGPCIPYCCHGLNFPCFYGL